MDAAHLLAFNATLLAALASPGPALLLALRTATVEGRAAGIATGAGLALMAATWTTVALLGLDAVFALVPWLYGALKLAGAVYLLWIAVQIWRDARAPLTATPQVSGRRAFARGLLVNLANPKSVLFAGAVLVVIFPGDLTGFEKSAIVLNHFCVELAAYTAFATLISTPRARAGYMRLKSGFDRVAALVLGALGLRLMFGR
ncbi:LysE family translocator [Litorisediminicola beolgyonensis]|uniref:LysE family translocator n=1 Tax=Litorisediminicola beolgyonensis TaxID=1173614 RepID=A0ABW3ZF37_9RHOB